MTIFPERDTRVHLCCLVITDYLETTDSDNFSTDTFLVRDLEVAYRLVLASRISLHSFEFFCFFDHFLGDNSKLSSLMGKYVCLIFVGLDFFIEARIGSILCFYAPFDLLESIIIVSYKLFDLSTPDIKIEDPISERIQKLSIMGDDEYCAFVSLEK